jgi:hypothetical protein
MNPIHQVYCTHCTYGTSYFHSASAEMASIPFEYSARAASMPAEPLRTYYRSIERYLTYHLPTDTPTEEKLALTASRAPHALFSAPQPEGVQIAGQVSFRPTDTRGRPGSYFAHVLFREAGDSAPAWSPCEVLQLWGSRGWVDQDSADLPAHLAELPSLAALLSGQPAALSDRVFHSFLTTPVGEAFHDPGCVIPASWRHQPASARQSIFRELFAALLEIAPEARARLTVVVEPALAALLFYGFFRLLPRQSFADALSWCTYESSPARPATILSATMFHAPQSTDLPPECYQSGRGYALHAFLGRRTVGRKLNGRYAPFVLDRLLEKDWEGVDGLLESLRASGASQAQELEALIGVQRLATLVLDPSLPALEQELPTAPLLRTHLRHVVAQEFTHADGNGQLAKCLGTPAHLRALEVLAATPATEPGAAIFQRLVEQLPEKDIATFLRLHGVTAKAKLTVLVPYVRLHGAFPPGCLEMLVASSASRHEGDPEGAWILNQLFAELEAPTIAALLKSTPADRRQDFIAPLQAAAKDSSKQSLLKGLLVWMVTHTSGPALCDFLTPERWRVLHALAGKDDALKAKMAEQLRELPKYLKGDVAAHLRMLQGARPFLGEQAEQLDAWLDCRQQLDAVALLLETRPRLFALGKRKNDDLDRVCRALASSFYRALRDERYPDEDGRLKLTYLQQWTSQRLGRPDALPANQWRKIELYFQGRGWKPLSQEKAGPKFRLPFRLPLDLSSRWTTGILAGGAVFLVLGLPLLFAVLRSSKKPDEPGQQAAARAERIEAQHTETENAAIAGANAARPQPAPNVPVDAKKTNPAPETDPAAATPARERPLEDWRRDGSEVADLERQVHDAQEEGARAVHELDAVLEKRSAERLKDRTEQYLAKAKPLLKEARRENERLYKMVTAYDFATIQPALWKSRGPSSAQATPKFTWHPDRLFGVEGKDAKLPRWLDAACDLVGSAVAEDSEDSLLCPRMREKPLTFETLQSACSKQAVSLSRRYGREQLKMQLWFRVNQPEAGVGKPGVFKTGFAEIDVKSIADEFVAGMVYGPQLPPCDFRELVRRAGWIDGLVDQLDRGIKAFGPPQP